MTPLLQDLIDYVAALDPLRRLGVGLAIVAAVCVSAALNRLWRASRIGRLGAPVVCACIAGAGAMLLQSLGAGDLRFETETGAVVWPPAISVLAVGGGIGGLFTAAIGLSRLGGRRRSD